MNKDVEEQERRGESRRDKEARKEGREEGEDVGEIPVRQAEQYVQARVVTGRE